MTITIGILVVLFVINGKGQQELVDNKEVELPEKGIIAEMVSQMTLEEKIGQMLMPDIRMWDGKSTTSMNEGTAQMIRDYHLGGVILFEKNIIDVEQLVHFTTDLQKEAEKIPLLISIDQEGGKVKRIPGGTNMPGNMALGATASEELSYEVGKAMGAELKALGINLNFAPVLDININPNNPVIGVRSFSADSQLVSSLGIQYIQGLHDAGVAATVKHFPGHGDTDVDSHLGLPLLPHNRDRLEEVELKPFRDAIEKGVDMVMTAHVTFPAIDNSTAISKMDGTEISIPATLSYKVLTELLREEMAFKGVIVTDAFTMKAISDHFGEEEAVVMAIEAGADIILMPNDLDIAYNAILDAVIAGEITEERIDESVNRILTFKEKYGILEKQEEILLEEKVNKASQVVGNSQHKAIEREAAEASVTLIKNDDHLLPMELINNQEILLLAPQAKQLELMVESLNQLSAEQEINLIIKEHIYSKSEDINNLVNEYGLEVDYVILGTMNLEEEIALTPHGISNIVVLALENPYDIMNISDIKANIAVYGGEKPNITAGMRAIFGLINPKGKLPVAVPALDEVGNLYDIGHGLSY